MDTQTATPRLRRAYFECRYGQLHVHNAIPAGGGFDEQTTLICLHAGGTTGRSFLPVSTLLATNRSVYSPDTPGCGESDGPPGALSIEGFAAAIADFVDSMRFRQIDLLGVHAGAAIAAELAIARPKVVRKLAMIGAPAFDESERRKLREQPAPDGASPGAVVVRAALSGWKAEARLPLIKQPLLVLRPRDEFREAGARVAKLNPDAQVIDLPQQDERLLESRPQLVVQQLSAFL
jgi:pimeloyl-ACP methyl ester carboxylesterase